MLGGASVPELQFSCFEERVHCFVAIAAREAGEFNREARLPIARVHTHNRLVDPQSAVDALLDLISCRLHLARKRFSAGRLCLLRLQEDANASLQVQTQPGRQRVMDTKPVDMQARVMGPVNICRTSYYHEDKQEQGQSFSLHGCCASSLKRSLLGRISKSL